ncbi:MAG TPA: knotted carbamoyltransferase YgeW [Acidobacteriota bacterium]|nr:knotted carbamoyltransferase YgeW [Acidobacteriota bacterium]
MSPIEGLIQRIQCLDIGMYGNDFLLTWEKTRSELEATLLVSEALKSLHKQNISSRVFESGIAVSHFRDNSTRTRFSYAFAANLLGLTVQDLDEGKSQIAHGETVRETANMISFLTEAIGIRDDIFLGAGHAYMREVADALCEGYRQGVLHQRPTIVNLQSDVDHPTQAMADLAHLTQHFGSLEELSGKKIAMTWAYSPSYGKPLSVPQGIIGLMTRFGMEVSLAYPEGYTLLEEVVSTARRNAAESGGSFQIFNSMEEAFADADVVYPKSWAPFSVMQRRTELLRAGDQTGLKELEKECLANNSRYKTWECNEQKMKLTRGGSALYMHCLPADISGVSCKEGEVQDSVFSRYRIETRREAGHKPFIIAAMILLARLRDASAALASLQRRAAPRVGI